VLKFIPLVSFAAMFASSLLRGLSVWRTSEVNPFPFVTAQGRQRLIGSSFGLCFGIIGAATIWIALSQDIASIRGLASIRELVGAGCALAGSVGLIVAQYQMGAAWRVGVRVGDAPFVVESGLYRLSRNPIYLAMVILAFGTALIVATWWVWAAFAGFIAACQMTILGEEAHLTDILGKDYTQFRERVPRWFGFVGGMN
jgi:protein-S-isoprenylcysteine O-methyltransferase Ste14